MVNYFFKKKKKKIFLHSCFLLVLLFPHHSLFLLVSDTNLFPNPKSNNVYNLQKEATLSFVFVVGIYERIGDCFCYGATYVKNDCFRLWNLIFQFTLQLQILSELWRRTWPICGLSDLGRRPSCACPLVDFFDNVALDVVVVGLWYRSGGYG